MTPKGSSKRLPKSLRKHLRAKKAALRRTLSPEDAEKAIKRLVQATVK